MKKNRSSKLGLEEFSHPLTELSHEQRIQLMKSVGKTAETKFPKKIDEFKQNLKEVNSELLLAVFSFYGLSWDGLSSDAERKISQHHVELLQAFLLSNETSNQNQLYVGHVFESVQESIEELSFMFAAKRFQNISDKSNESDSTKQNILEHMRLDTQFTRNAGHPDQIEKFTYELFSKIDDIHEFDNGVKIGSLVKFLFKIVLEIEARLNAHNEKLMDALQKNRPQKIIRKYMQSFLVQEENERSLLNEFVKEGWSTKDLRVILLNHSELFLPDIYKFSINDLLALYPDDLVPDVLRNIINNWCLAFGDLADEKFEHFFMANPIWKKPFIGLDKDSYFLPIPGLIVSYCVELLEEFISTSDMDKSSYHDMRGVYLEDKVAELIAISFPLSNVYKNSKWSDTNNPTTVYENDLSILVDNTIIVFEAKAGKISDVTRRGASERLQRNIDELIANPSEQANRFIRKLQENKGVHKFHTARGENYEIDSSKIDHFIPITITLDFWGALSSHLPTLQNANLLALDSDVSIILSLFDLDILFDILDGVSQKIHYIQWRQIIENLVSYEADEIDLLVVYLKDAFHQIVTDYANDMFVNLYGESDMLNPYFMRNHHLQIVEKPVRPMANWIQNVITKLEQDRTTDWLNIATTLYSLELEQQHELEDSLHITINQTKRKKTDNQYSSFRRSFSIIDNHITFIIINYGHGNTGIEQNILKVIEGAKNEDIRGSYGIRQKIPQVKMGLIFVGK